MDDDLGGFLEIGGHGRLDPTTRRMVSETTRALRDRVEVEVGVRRLVESVEPLAPCECWRDVRLFDLRTASREIERWLRGLNAGAGEIVRFWGGIKLYRDPFQFGYSIVPYYVPVADEQRWSRGTDPPACALLATLSRDFRESRHPVAPLVATVVLLGVNAFTVARVCGSADPGWLVGRRAEVSFSAWGPYAWNQFADRVRIPVADLEAPPEAWARDT